MGRMVMISVKHLLKFFGEDAEFAMFRKEYADGGFMLLMAFKAEYADNEDFQKYLIGLYEGDNNGDS